MDQPSRTKSSISIRSCKMGSFAKPNSAQLLLLPLLTHALHVKQNPTNKASTAPKSTKLSTVFGSSG
ncbi:substrate carrier family protein X [Fusarium oxysporum f. sp. albedinis]|nr:substrate carrier family protein X [Fusarium oxysporum f. sp. albedinis]